MNILFLTGRLPYPPTRGDRLRAYHFMRVLSRKHNITLLSFIEDERETGNIGPLREFCHDIQLVHRGQLQSTITTAMNLWRPSPLQSLYYRSSVMKEAVDRLLDRRYFDLVYVHLFRMAQFVANRQRPYRILDLTDAISAEIEHSLPYQNQKWRLIYRAELPRIKRHEQDIVNKFDETWVISNSDRQQILKTRQDERVIVVPNGVDTDRYRPLGIKSTAPRLIFVGHMGVFHNIDAANYLAREILPIIRESVPEVQLNLVGADPAPQVKALAKIDGVKVLGHVTDLNASLNASTVFVAPLRFAAGIQNKVLEAMAAGLPVVTTSIVNSGLEATDGEHVIIGDDSQQIARATISLLRDPVTRQRLGNDGRIFVLENFRWNDVLDRVNAIEMKISR